MISMVFLRIEFDLKGLPWSALKHGLECAALASKSRALTEKRQEILVREKDFSLLVDYTDGIEHMVKMVPPIRHVVFIG